MVREVLQSHIIDQPAIDEVDDCLNDCGMKKSKHICKIVGLGR